MDNPTGLIAASLTDKDTSGTTATNTVAPATSASAPMGTSSIATSDTQVYNPISNTMVAAPTPATQQYVNQVAAPSAPSPRDITANETVAGQLNQLLSEESPYMQSAKNKALEQANARGLLNSSIAVGSAQRAAIDAALPIAQSDASTYAASGLSAQNAGQQITQTGYEGNINSALNREKFGYDSTLNTQNISANSALQTQKTQEAIDAQKQLNDLGLNVDLEKLKAVEKDSVSNLIQQYQQQVSLIDRTPDEQMNSFAKDAAIAKQRSALEAAISLYSYEIDWTRNGIYTAGNVPLTSNEGWGSSEPLPIGTGAQLPTDDTIGGETYQTPGLLSSANQSWS